MNELAAQKIVQYLYEAHATELMLAQTLTAHIAITPAGDYRDGLELHLRETNEHARRIQEHLARRGRERGIVQVGYGVAQGVVSQVLAMGKLPVDIARGMSGEEKLLKNAKDECANEAMEIATYFAIEELATSVGDTATARLAASIRKDEERMLERLLDLIPRLASDVVRAEVRGESRFDVRHIGAVDAARTVAGSAARIVARSANRTGRRAEQSKHPARRSPTPQTVSERAESATRRASATSGTRSKASTTQRATTKRKPAKRTTAGTKAGAKRSGTKATS